VIHPAHFVDAICEPELLYLAGRGPDDGGVFRMGSYERAVEGPASVDGPVSEGPF